MDTWTIWHEEADSNTPAQVIGTTQANTMSEALENASKQHSIPSYDLTAKRTTTTHTITSGRNLPGTNTIETTTLRLSVNHVSDNETLSIKMNDAQFTLDAYRALELLNFLAEQRNSVLDLVAKKNRQAAETRSFDPPNESG